MNFKLNASIAALALALPVFSGAAFAAETVRMTIGAGLPATSASIALIESVLIPEIDKRLAETGNYEIEWTTGWGGAIAGQFDMFEAVEDGIVDMASVNTLFEGAKLPLEQVTFVTPFGSTDLAMTMEVFDDIRAQLPALDEQFLKHNQRRLAVTGLVNYHLMSTYEVKSLADLEGRKFGTPGLAANWLEGTGATPVSGSLSDYYNSLKTGVYDGIAIFQSGIAAYKFHEVAPYITQVGFGSQLTTNLTINEDKWESLPEEVQQVIVDASDVYTQAMLEKYIAIGETSMKTAVEGGAKVSELPKDEVAKLAASLPNIATVWASAADDKGLPGTQMLDLWMQGFRDRGIEFARDWDKE